MLKGIYRSELAIAAALVAGAGLAMGIYFYGSMPPIKGLKISAPDFASINQQFKQAAPAQNLNQVGSASFMAAMGLNIAPQTIIASASEIGKKTEEVVTPPPASAAAQITEVPRFADLDKAGYKLRGIVLEDGRSAAFVFVPGEKRVMVIRENARGTIKLLEAGLRSVKLQTPDGTGILNLENARQAPGNTASPGGSSGLPGTGTNAAGSSRTTGSAEPMRHGQAPDQPGEPRQPEGEVKPDPSAGPNAIASNINSGQLRLSQDRGKFSVEVREIPDTLKGYDIKPGDKIIGTDAGDFSKAQDVARNLGSVGERPQNLRVKRDGRVIFIKAPTPPRSEKTGSKEGSPTTDPDAKGQPEQPSAPPSTVTP